MRSWTSKNKKWHVEVAEAVWDDLYPHADGYITERRSKTDIWFQAKSRRQQRAYRVEDLVLDIGFTYDIEIPAYVEQKAIELASLAISDAQRAADGRPYCESDFGGFGRLHNDVGGMSLRILRSMREMTLNRLEALETTPRGPSRMESYAMEHAELDRDLAMIDEEIRRRGASPFGAYRPKKPKQFKVGQIVRHTGEFLRNTGQFVGAPINGRVEALKPMMPNQPSWPVVLWNDADEPRMVNPVNIELDPRARKINEKVGFSGSGEGYTLEFLPYLTPEFPEFQGLVEEVYSTQREAEARMRSLIARHLVEQARLYKGRSRWMPVRMWDANHGWLE